MRKIEFTMDNIAKWLKESTDWLIDNQQGCCTLKLDMRTDFDFINFPFCKGGDVYDDTYTIAKDEDFDWLANALITDYEVLEGLEIDKEGLIKEAKNA